MEFNLISAIKRLDLRDRLTFHSVWIGLTSLCIIFAITIVACLYYMFLPEVMEEHANTIKSFAALCAAIIATPLLIFFSFLIAEIKKLQVQLYRKIQYDSLTGALSRDTFLKKMEKDIQEKESLRDDAVLIIDADKFKNINDTFGHLVGDKALIAITKALSEGVRETDLLGRLGGEEFVILLRNTNRSLALSIAERLRQKVRIASEQLGVEDLELSISIGLVTYNTNPNPINLLQIADQLLYRAKAHGRNRVEFETYMPEAISV